MPVIEPLLHWRETRTSQKTRKNSCAVPSQKCQWYAQASLVYVLTIHTLLVPSQLKWGGWGIINKNHTTCSKPLHRNALLPAVQSYASLNFSANWSTPLCHLWNTNIHLDIPFTDNGQFQILCRTNPLSNFRVNRVTIHSLLQELHILLMLYHFCLSLAPLKLLQTIRTMFSIFFILILSTRSGSVKETTDSISESST